MLSAATMTLLPASHRSAPCSCSYRSSPALGMGYRGRPRRAALLVRAQEGEQPPQAGPQAEDNRESMLEALEAQARARKGAKAAQMDLQRPPSAQRAQQRGGGSAKVEWKEGQLFPEGWEQMDVPTKMYQLYMGERGFMFWANKAALASIVILGVAWIGFRFVGPALGLYQLQSDFLSPSAF